MTQHKKKSEKTNEFHAYAFALNLGFRIVIPLVFLALGGRMIDTIYHTSPLFLLAGILFSIIITSFMIYRQTKPIINNMANKDKKRS